VFSRLDLCQVDFLMRVLHTYSFGVIRLTCDYADKSCNCLIKLHTSVRGGQTGKTHAAGLQTLRAVCRPERVESLLLDYWGSRYVVIFLAHFAPAGHNPRNTGSEG